MKQLWWHRTVGLAISLLLLVPVTGLALKDAPAPWLRDLCDAQSQMQGVFAYITSIEEDVVQVLDTAGNQLIKTIQVGKGPRGVGAHPEGLAVYVSNREDNTISVIDTISNTVMKTVRTGPAPIGVAVHPNGSTFYVANRDNNTVWAIDTASFEVLARIRVGGSPRGVAARRNGLIYIANYDGRSVSVINPANQSVIETINISMGNPMHLAVHPDGSRVYVATQENAGNDIVAVVDTATNTEIETIPIGDEPFGVAVHPAGKILYVPNLTNGNVSVIDTDSNRVIKEITVGTRPHGVAMHPDGTSAYVPNINDGTVSIINTTTHTVTETVPVRPRPVTFGEFVLLVPLSQIGTDQN